MIRVTVGNIYQQYEINATGTATVGQLLAYNIVNERQKLILEAQGDKIYFKFGDSTVTASKTVTANALPAGNFSIPSGAIFEVDLPTGTNLNYVSTIGVAGTGVAIVRLANAGT